MASRSPLEVLWVYYVLCIFLLDLGDSFMDGLRYIVDVPGCQAAHVDPTTGH